MVTVALPEDEEAAMAAAVLCHGCFPVVAGCQACIGSSAVGFPSAYFPLLRLAWGLAPLSQRARPVIQNSAYRPPRT